MRSAFKRAQISCARKSGFFRLQPCPRSPAHIARADALRDTSRPILAGTSEDRRYRDGENVVIEYRFANGQMERLPALAADLVLLGADIIIVTGGNSTTLAAMKATTTIPIVMTSGIDPVSAGLVASLARPGGNVTGLAVDAGNEILGKRFEMLKQMLPNLSRLGILFNPDVEVNRSRLTSMTETARALGLTTIPVEASGLDALEQAFAVAIFPRTSGGRPRTIRFIRSNSSTLR
jgi:ABC-type uncharacterized transport system substrate-binding protein